MPESFGTVNDAFRWVWEEKHQQLLGTRPAEIAFMWLRLGRWLNQQRYTVPDGTQTLQISENTKWYLWRGDRLFRSKNFEAIWNLSLHPLSDELRIIIRAAWLAGSLPGGPGLQPEDKQPDQQLLQDSPPLEKPDYKEIGRWLERWLKDGQRVSIPRCWNCSWFTIPLSGAHYCTQHASQVDCLYHCEYWEARRSA